MSLLVIVSFKHSLSNHATKRAAPAMAAAGSKSALRAAAARQRARQSSSSSNNTVKHHHHQSQLQHGVELRDLEAHAAIVDVHRLRAADAAAAADVPVFLRGREGGGEPQKRVCESASQQQPCFATLLCALPHTAFSALHSNHSPLHVGEVRL